MRIFALQHTPKITKLNERLSSGNSRLLKRAEDAKKPDSTQKYTREVVLKAITIVSPQYDKKIMGGIQCIYNENYELDNLVHSSTNDEFVARGNEIKSDFDDSTRVVGNSAQSGDLDQVQKATTDIAQLKSQLALASNLDQLEEFKEVLSPILQRLITLIKIISLSPGVKSIANLSSNVSLDDIKKVLQGVQRKLNTIGKPQGMPVLSNIQAQIQAGFNRGRAIIEKIKKVNLADIDAMINRVSKKYYSQLTNKTPDYGHISQFGESLCVIVYEAYNPVDFKTPEGKSLFESHINKLDSLPPFGEKWKDIIDDNFDKRSLKLIKNFSLAPDSPSKEKTQTSQPEDEHSNKSKQEIDTKILKIFNEQEKSFMATDQGKQIDATAFNQAVDAVAKKYSEIVSEHLYSRENIRWELVEQIAKILCKVLFLASQARTAASKREVAKTLEDLEKVWPGAGGIIKRIQTGGQLLKTLSTFCMTGDNYNADFKELMIVTHQKFKNLVVDALKASVESCKTNTQCTEAFTPHSNLLGRITEEGDHLLGQPKTINDTLSKGGDKFGPGEMSMAKDVILNSLSRKNYFDNPTGGDTPEKTNSEEASAKILNYIASYGKTGGLIDWTNTSCTLPSDWAHPGVILFGSIVLWVLARMVQTGER